MELQEVYALMDRFAASGLTALEWEKEGEQVKLRRESVVPAAPASAPAPVLQEDAKAEEGGLVTAPLVGVFYAASAPEESPYVTAGAQVKKGDTLCLIEAMKMMSEVPAPADCVVEEVLAQKNQFSTYASGVLRKTEPSPSSIIAAKLVMDGGEVPQVAGALYFDSASGSWASRNRTFAGQIGNHRFYY